MDEPRAPVEAPALVSNPADTRSGTIQGDTGPRCPIRHRRTVSLAPIQKTPSPTKRLISGLANSRTFNCTRPHTVSILNHLVTLDDGDISCKSMGRLYRAPAVDFRTSENSCQVTGLERTATHKFLILSSLVGHYSPTGVAGRSAAAWSFPIGEAHWVDLTLP